MSADFSFVYSAAKEMGAAIVEAPSSQVEAIEKAVQVSFIDSLPPSEGKTKKKILDVQVRAYGKNKDASPHYLAGYLCYFSSDERFIFSQNL